MEPQSQDRNDCGSINQFVWKYLGKLSEKRDIYEAKNY